MRPSQIRFQKAATIYGSEKFISIEALSGASALMYREDGGRGVYLEPEVADEALGQALLTALGKSRFVDPRSERAFFDPNRAARAYADWQKDFMRRYGYKSKREAFRNLDWCYARMPEGKISIEPHRRDRLGSWRSLPPDRTVVIPATTDPVAAGAALRLALDRCE
jgi:CDI immunity protein